nr:MAG TPA: hypothetical protein [Caudoviricetes sp.]
MVFSREMRAREPTLMRIPGLNIWCEWYYSIYMKNPVKSRFWIVEKQGFPFKTKSSRGGLKGVPPTKRLSIFLPVVMMILVTVSGGDLLPRLSQHYAAQLQHRGIAQKVGSGGPLRHRCAEILVECAFLVFLITVPVQWNVVIQGDKAQIFQSLQESPCLFDRLHVVGCRAQENRRQGGGDKIFLPAILYREPGHGQIMVVTELMEKVLLVFRHLNRHGMGISLAGVLMVAAAVFIV